MSLFVSNNVIGWIGGSMSPYGVISSVVPGRSPGGREEKIGATS